MRRGSPSEYTRQRWAAFLVLLSVLAPGTAWAGSGSASVTVSIVPPSALRIVQGEKFGWDYCGNSYSFTLSTPVQPGNAIVGATGWEAPPGCDGGSPDVITLGSQQATLVQTVWPSDFGLGYCCPQASSFVLFNVSGAQSVFTIASSNGGNFRPPIGFVTEVAGLGSGASVDGFGHYYRPAGTGNDVLSSDPITPSASGDFLYGWQFSVYTEIGALYAGTGWTAGSIYGVCSMAGLCAGDPLPVMDEYKLNYNSTNPIAATFGTTNGSGEWATGIIAIKH